MRGWLYALACVAVPALWGVVMYHLFGLWERRGTKPPAPVEPPIDFSI